MTVANEDGCIDMLCTNCTYEEKCQNGAIQKKQIF